MALQLANTDIQLTSAANPVVQVGPNSQVTILKATACNTDTAARTITVYRVQNGGSPSDAGAILVDTLAISAGETIVLPISGQTLVQQQSLEALADVSAKVNLNLSYALLAS